MDKGFVQCWALTNQAKMVILICSKFPQTQPKTGWKAARCIEPSKSSSPAPLVQALAQPSRSHSTRTCGGSGCSSVVSQATSRSSTRPSSARSAAHRSGPTSRTWPGCDRQRVSTGRRSRQEQSALWGQPGPWESCATRSQMKGTGKSLLPGGLSQVFWQAPTGCWEDSWIVLSLDGAET